MSYDYDFNTILKSALLKNNCSNKSIDAFNNDCMYAPFNNNEKDFGNLECITKSLSVEHENNDSNYGTYYNYDSLIEENAVEGEGDAVGEGGERDAVGEGDSSNFFMQGSMKDNYKIVDNNFKEIAEKILLDINCDEDTLNMEVVNYEQMDNSSNIKKIERIYNDTNKKIETLRIEVNAINTLESNLQSIIDNLKISNNNSSITDKFKNNINNVIYYNTYFKFIVYLKQQKNILEDNINTEQLNINAIMYLVMKNKWFNIAPNVYKLFNQHLQF